jgi:KipI family sensor histidine kinase inhibitor
VKLRRAGADGLLVELDDLDTVLRLAAELRRRAPPGIVEIVPAARTVLLVGAGLEALAAELPGWPLPPLALPARTPLEIPVTYDGPDLDEVCALTGLARDALIELHTGATLTTAFCGFAPGFGYLSGLPRRLHVPRRATPRAQVAAGSVGLAGEFTGVYPRASPGGWHLIGHTTLALWDERSHPPSRLAPGVPVRFVRAAPP